MTSYTVTITADDPDLAVTTIRLDVIDAAASIRELRLTPGAGGGLLPGGLPVLDLNHLVAAVIAAVAPGTGSTAVQQVAAPAHQNPATAQPKARKRGGGRARSTEDALAAPPRARKKAAGKGQAVKAAEKTTSASMQQGAGGRTYRRVPDDFDQVLRQAGESASVIADHYGVPRHTAYSWIRSARKRAEATA